MLFEFHSCELSHVGPGGGVRYVVGTANNVPPQSHYLLPLYELKSVSESDRTIWKGCFLHGRAPEHSSLALAAGTAALWL